MPYNLVGVAHVIGAIAGLVFCDPPDEATEDRFQKSFQYPTPNKFFKNIIVLMY